MCSACAVRRAAPGAGRPEGGIYTRRSGLQTVCVDTGCKDSTADQCQYLHAMSYLVAGSKASKALSTHS